VPGHQRVDTRVLGFAILCALCLPGGCARASEVDVQEIVRGGTAAIRSDWAADPDYAFVERDETQKNGKLTSKTSEVVMMLGSDYYMPLAFDDQRLSPEQQKIELQKLKNEFNRRNGEDQTSRERRIINYRKARDEDGAMLLDFPDAFNFKILREETLRGYEAWVLSGTPRERSGPLSRAAKVLSGMNGTVWIENEHLHCIRADLNVVASVPLFGSLAHVLPGTRIDLEMTPVSDSTWLVDRFAMTLKVSKLWFKSTHDTRSTYSDFRLNSTELDELLAKADLP
jgi:hypothetical protein